MQEFGDLWTEAKLEVVENYIKFYTTALKKQNFRLCYIDAFAGSGSVKVKDGRLIDGSAVRAIKYPFDKFIFFEKNKSKIEELKQKIMVSNRGSNDVEFHNADCNVFLQEIGKIDWTKEKWRGVIFLDPFAMDLVWESLAKISETKIFDVWYLFPFMAINRNLRRDGQIPKANKESVTRILGTSDWYDAYYSPSPQQHLPLFGDSPHLQKVGADGIRDFIITRLRQTFPTVSPKAAVIKNMNNSPMFLLCFAGSNPKPRARELSLKSADYILERFGK